MIGLNDSRWQSFRGGYRLPFDASPWLRKLEADPTTAEEVWEQFWNELHHQGDVDEASYATAPQLVRICVGHDLLDWNAFALVATIEECRVFGANPELPEWLESDYHAAFKELAGFGAKHFHKSWPKELVQSFLAVAAFAKDAPKTARLLIAFSEDEMAEVYDKFFL
jgi:hypothetical protein